MNKFDRVFGKKVWSLIKLYWSSSERRVGVRLLACVAVFSVSSIALGAYTSYLSRDSTNALVGKHLTQSLAGISREGSGRATRPSINDVMFLPQRLCMILDSLRDQLTYPRAIGRSGEQLHDALGR